MNRSYSKIRHIQEANLMLENRRLVSNNRLFLMEQVVGDYFNTMNSTFSSQIAAYVNAGYVLPVTLKLNSDGTISILWSNQVSYTTTSSLSQAITYNEGAGDPKSKVTQFGNQMKAGWVSVATKSQNKDVQKSNSPVSGALQSGINSIINTYFKNQPSQNK